MDEFNSIVVLGAMNPKIHHPHWYFAQDLLTEAERDAALAADLVCTPPLAQFRAPEFTVVCQQQRWEIQTTIVGAAGRVKDIAGQVFTILDETPVAAFGFNVNAQRATSCPSVSDYLAERIIGIGIGFEEQAGASVSAQLAFQALSDGRRLSVNVSPSKRSGGHVQVAINTHYELSGVGVIGPGEHFDLAKLIKEHFPQDRKAALAQIDRIAASIDQRHGGESLAD